MVSNYEIETGYVRQKFPVKKVIPYRWNLNDVEMMFNLKSRDVEPEIVVN